MGKSGEWNVGSGKWGVDPLIIHSPLPTRHCSLPQIAILLATAMVTFACASSFGKAPSGKPKLVALPRSVVAPKDNPTTRAKVELGKLLFFDPRLSGDNRMRCATCHRPEKAFGDGRRTAEGAGRKALARNTPTLLNAAFYSTYFWDGRAGSLEEQALAPIQSPHEMNQDVGELVKELAAVPEYGRRFVEVFGRPVNRKDIAKALATFQRTLVTRDSPFDRFLAGDKDALSARAQAGLALFKGEAGCIRCHNGPLLSDGKYYRLGISRGDRGRGAVTNRPEDLYRFRTPSLRNVAQTAPYMHNGSMKTLDDVVTFYFRGVPSSTVDGKSLDVEPLLGASFSDMTDIVVFLESLSGAPPRVVVPDVPEVP